MSKKKPSLKKQEQDLLDQLTNFYWDILQDPDLKPSDRIASARRLEALLGDSVEEDSTTPVSVTLNLPEGKKTLKSPQKPASKKMVPKPPLGENDQD